MDHRVGCRYRIAVFLCLCGVSASLLFSSCAAVSGRGDQPPTRAGEPRPAWRTGDRWLHAWTLGTNKGVKASEYIGVREVGGVSYNVLRTEAADHYYTPELHWAASLVESRVVARATPPQPWFNWPLETGKRWQYQGVYETPESKNPLRDSYRIVGMESVTVPGGTFRAFRIVREMDTAVVDEYWYAPDVRWYVKWVGRRGKDEFQEVLQAFAPASQSGVPAPVADRPPTPGGSPPRR